MPPIAWPCSVNGLTMRPTSSTTRESSNSTPKLDGTGQVLPGGPRRPLTVAQRLTLEHQLARVEFLARIGLRVSP
jgi:hypothetical protein